MHVFACVIVRVCVYLPKGDPRAKQLTGVKLSRGTSAEAFERKQVEQD